jgi:hypothetical protein
MDNRNKRDVLEGKLNELLGYKESLSEENLDDFQKLKSEILDLLDDNQKIRFNRIDFFNQTTDYEDVDNLPF